MARPTQGLILDLLRPLGTCRAQSVLQSSTKLVRSSVLINAPRFLSTSRTQYAIFNRSGDHAPSAPIAPDSPASTDAPLTPFQLQIAALETEALAKPTSLPDQLALLNALLEGGEVQGLVKYYETIALDESIEEGVGAEGSGRKTLVGSEEAWGLYVVALGRVGRLSEISKMVRKRDNILGNIKSIPTSAPLSTPATSAPSPFPQASATSATASTSTASPTSTASTAPISDSATAPRAPIVQSLLASRTQAGSAQTAAASETSTGIPGAGAGGATPGTPLSPIHVQLAPASPTSSFWRVARSIIVSLLWIFVFLTVFGMVGESTGLLKGGAKPAIFEPEEGKTVKFSDVHGVEEAKNELEEVVEFLRNPEKFSTLGGKLPKGVLLTGPPGTGKTMLARAVAGEAEVPFLFASGSSFDEMFVGVGAKRVRELFQVAREKAPAIIFIDELDAIGSKRSARDQHYMKQTLNQLLVELDGFAQTEGVIIIGATNFPESLDKALTRPGRFDKHVVVGLPDVRGRVEILKHHMGDVQYDVDVDPSVIARGCPGMSGADLQNLVNQAAVKAARDNAKSVQLKHFEWAKDRILMGAERKSHYVTEESKKATAYHEGGHALVALHTPGAMPLHKVTIMPRGQALGITFQLPEQDKDSYSRKEYNAMIDVALGGRAAEEMIFGRDDVTSGCSSDLQRATDVATRMIRSYGFSDKVGLVAHGDEESVYLSGRKKDEIEGEIRSFLDQSMQRAEKCLKDHEQELHTLASALVEYETLNLDEVKQVLAGKKLQRLASLGDSLKGTKEATAGPDGPIVEGI